MDVGNAYPVCTGSLRKASIVLEGLKSVFNSDVTLNSAVYVTHMVTVHGQTYRTGSVLLLKTQYYGECLFGEIIHIIPQADTESFLMFSRILSVEYFEYFYAYVVKQTKD